MENTALLLLYRNVSQFHIHSQSVSPFIMITSNRMKMTGIQYQFSFWHYSVRSITMH